VSPVDRIPAALHIQAELKKREEISVHIITGKISMRGPLGGFNRYFSIEMLVYGAHHDREDHHARPTVRVVGFDIRLQYRLGLIDDCDIRVGFNIYSIAFS
jgi:hypothetical protein